MSVYQQLAEIAARGETVVVCTVVRTSGSTPRRAGSKMLVFPDGNISGTIGGGEMESLVVSAAINALSTNKPDLLQYEFVDPKRGDPGICGGRMEIYVEPIQPPTKIIIYGAGHVGRALADLATWLGFAVVLADDRSEYLTAEGLPEGVELLHCEAKELVDLTLPHARSAVVLTTRTIELDVTALPAVLAAKPFYIGVIGSRRRWQTTRKQLLEAGLEELDLAKIISPIGLEIDAETPKEIALSVLAEIIMVLNGGSGKQMGVGLQSGREEVE